MTSSALHTPRREGRALLVAAAGSGDAVVDASTIVDNLKMAFMGSFEVSKGPWGLFTDVLYRDIGNTKSGLHEIGIAAAGCFLRTLAPGPNTT
jgi:hypothetical protein